MSGGLTDSTTALDGEQQQSARRDAIHAAAIDEFSERGFAATSMANIADSAGMSRPALYQYFRNKQDIFASAFIALVSDHVDRALAALRTASPIDAQLDEFLQRFDGDLWQHMAASPYSEEILGAKNPALATAIGNLSTRLSAGLEAYLTEIATERSPSIDGRIAGWIEVIRLAPKGFKIDQPSVESYRRRLKALATSVAADVVDVAGP